MKIGAEDKKKLYFLIALGLVAAYGLYNAFSGPSAPSVKPSASDVSLNRNGELTTDVPIPAPVESSAPRNARTGRSEEFHPVLRSKRKEDQIDPFKIDPELKLYILARLQEVPAAGGGRNLFQFGAAPPAKLDLPKTPEPIVKVATVYGPPLDPLKPKVVPPPPPPPPPAPFNAKYYGLATQASNGTKRAFFLDGEDIIIKSEGEMVKGHFRIVRIGLTSVVVEDTESKRQQTVQIAEEAQG